MANLFPCKDCKKQISTSAKSCPNCGRPVQRADIPGDKTVSISRIIWLVTSFFTVLIFFVIIGETEEEKVVRVAQEATKRQALVAAQEKVLQYFRENDAKAVLDTAWLDDETLGLGMRDDGTPRDGFAAYACEAVRGVGYPITPITIRIIDVVQLRHNKEWITLGRNRCDNIVAQGTKTQNDAALKVIAEYKNNPVSADTPHNEEFQGNKITFNYVDESDAGIHGDYMRVLHVLAQKCPSLFETHGAAIQYIAPQLGWQTNSAGCKNTLLCPQYGWPNDMTFRIKMTNKATVAAGDTLFFWAGGGEQPGFATRQKAAQKICGWPENGHGDDKTFQHIDAPELSFLNDIPVMRFLDEIQVPDVQETAKQKKIKQVENAFVVFKEKCPQLFSSYLDDVEGSGANAQFRDIEYCEHDYWCETYGWKNQIDLEIKIKDDPQKIPGAVGAGHILYYKLGAGHSPGISAAKDVSAILCGWQPNEDGSDLFTPVPELAFIDD